jgi:hypothetical protein
MTQRITVRIDNCAASCLRIFENAGYSRSDAVSLALVAAADIARERGLLRQEVAALEADPAERAEMQATAEFMAGLRSNP